MGSFQLKLREITPKMLLSTLVEIQISVGNKRLNSAILTFRLWKKIDMGLNLYLLLLVLECPNLSLFWLFKDQTEN